MGILAMAIPSQLPLGSECQGLRADTGSISCLERRFGCSAEAGGSCFYTVTLLSPKAENPIPKSFPSKKLHAKLQADPRTEKAPGW